MVRENRNNPAQLKTIIRTFGPVLSNGATNIKQDVYLSPSQVLWENSETSRVEEESVWGGIFAESISKKEYELCGEFVEEKEPLFCGELDFEDEVEDENKVKEKENERGRHSEREIDISDEICGDEEGEVTARGSVELDVFSSSTIEANSTERCLDSENEEENNSDNEHNSDNNNDNDNDDETTSQITVCDDNYSDNETYNYGLLSYQDMLGTGKGTHEYYHGGKKGSRSFEASLMQRMNENLRPEADDLGDKTPRSESSTIHECEEFPVALCEDKRTVFQLFTSLGIDWCRYCGTTEGINWRPGPWGKRTLCNKHGCDYKGYGFASKTPRLDLRSFIGETVEQRIMPVLQSYCYVCLSDKSPEEDPLLSCIGCPNSYHLKCYEKSHSTLPYSQLPWLCHSACRDSFRKKRIVVELQKRKLPFMCSSSLKRFSSESSDISLSPPASSLSPASPPSSRKRSPSTSPAFEPELKSTRSLKKRKSGRPLKLSSKGLTSGICLTG
ncbi:hypothetical protein AX774_g2059 [Zancudomyces culisetae]|nr:hypothetical protein AX774_g2059 [Zancudomyces culisetae]|eukprot:OMH84419.1 hypothetical protein AX774_g2059 [Zancudomyces culisetae]